MPRYDVKPLNPDTWPDFAALVEKHNGVWSGCWCMSFHDRDGEEARAKGHRYQKERLVLEGRTHSALVYDGAACVGWCQFGSPAELPRIKHRREYEAGLAGEGGAAAVPGGAGVAVLGEAVPGEAGAAALAGGSGAASLPDWRITCFFVDRDHRGRGVAEAALVGALDEIARFGGGRVESYPEDTSGRKVSNSFLYNATLSLFERHGFERVRRLGKHHWVVSRMVTARTSGSSRK